jgi:hypothetical protein
VKYRLRGRVGRRAASEADKAAESGFGRGRLHRHGAGLPGTAARRDAIAGGRERGTGIGTGYTEKLPGRHIFKCIAEVVVGIER